MLLADLDPTFRAWLEAAGYLNGFGPRSITLPGGMVVRMPWHPPTPGCRAVFLQHDLDQVVGGTEGDRLDGDEGMRAGLLAVASRSWWLSRTCIEAATPTLFRFVRANGSAHFRHRNLGPRSLDELKASLQYPH